MKKHYKLGSKITFLSILAFFAAISLSPKLLAQEKEMSSEEIETLKAEIITEIDKRQKFTQEMVDMIFSFGELGMQEFETSKYITDILKKNGFEVEVGMSGMPTAWIARWGEGKPIIAVGSDIDGIPKTSQKPGVAYQDPIIEGAPGHGEGHNSGQAVNITAALALKKIMERENLPGTLMLWPGVAEEQLAGKAFFVNDGVFEEVDACLFTHVSNRFSTIYGGSKGNGMVSVQFEFEGESAHSAGAPWRGKSALDAVELMNIGWNFKREHLYPTQRSHYVIPDGGDQPNVVPSKASVWYFLRERTYPGIVDMYDQAVKIAEGAAMMTDTKMTYRFMGGAWPGHFNKILAETMQDNMESVGMPEWSEADQRLARAVQKEMDSEQEGLNSEIVELSTPGEFSLGGGSDDIGDVSWVVPTVRLRFPSNIPGLPGHHWSNSISMATPIAHKGATAGAKVIGMTLIDLFTKPEIITEAWKYYNEVQTKDTKYKSFITSDDEPPIELNKEIMAEFRPQMKKFYYDPSKYATYLEQLGIKYPTLEKEDESQEKQ